MFAIKIIVPPPPNFRKISQKSPLLKTVEFKRPFKNNPRMGERMSLRMNELC